MNGHRRALALTMGDPAGIGPDLALAAWTHRVQLELPAFLMIADPAMLAERALLLGLDVPLVEATAEGAVAKFDSALPVLPVELARPAVPGHPDSGNADAIIEAIRIAVELTTAGQNPGGGDQPDRKIGALCIRFRVSRPHRVFGRPGQPERRSCRHPGHAACRPFPARRSGYHPHPACRQVPDALRTDAIVETTRIMSPVICRCRRFGVARPRIADLGPQSPCRRGWRPGARGRRDHPARNCPVEGRGT
jgi:4-hydroxythreonine-4-phosphate dehydrogenase